MGFWANYKPEDYDTVFDCSDGDHTLTIVKVEPKQSKNNNDMIEVSFKVDNIGVYYVERYTDNEYFNKIITRFFDAFGIPRGNFTFKSWFGKQAQGHFIHKEETFAGKDGQPKTVNKARLQYLIVPDSDNDSYKTYQNTETVAASPSPKETAGASAAFDKKPATELRSMTKESADELNKMFASGIFTQQEAMTYYNQFQTWQVEEKPLLWTVRKEYTTRLNKNTASVQPPMDIF